MVQIRTRNCPLGNVDKNGRCIEFLWLQLPLFLDPANLYLQFMKAQSLFDQKVKQILQFSVDEHPKHPLPIQVEFVPEDFRMRLENFHFLVYF